MIFAIMSPAPQNHKLGGEKTPDGRLPACLPCLPALPACLACLRACLPYRPACLPACLACLPGLPAYAFHSLSLFRPFAFPPLLLFRCFTCRMSQLANRIAWFAFRSTYFVCYISHCAFRISQFAFRSERASERVTLRRISRFAIRI